MIYSLYIFDRHCKCVYFQDWHRRISPSSNQVSSIPGTPTANSSVLGRGTPLRSAISTPMGLMSPSLMPSSPNIPVESVMSNPGNGLAIEEEAKLVYGVVYSLRNMIAKLSKTGQSGMYFAYTTSMYKMHAFSTLSGLRFVLLTDPEAGNIRDVLQRIFAQYVEFVVKNPLSRPREPGVPLAEGETEGAVDQYVVANDYFRSVVNKFVRSLPLYAS